MIDLEKALFTLQNVQNGNIDNVSIERVIEDIKAELRKKANKASGCADVAKCAEKIIKGTDNYNHFRGKMLPGAGGSLFTDGYRVLWASADVDTANADKVEPGFADRIFGMLKTTLDTCTEFLELPSAAELKQDKKLLKLENPKAKKFAFCVDGKISFNIDYLIEAIEATGASRLMWQQSSKAPVYMQSENGSVKTMILPVLTKENRPAGAFALY